MKETTFDASDLDFSKHAIRLVNPEQQQLKTNEIRFGFPDGTFATFKEAKSLQEFLDKMTRYHELEKDLEIAKKAMNQVMIMGASNNTCSFLKAKTVKSILGKALEQIEHKEQI